MGKKYELQRTCKRCAVVWFVPADQSDPPKKAKGSGLATPLFGKRRNELRAQDAMIAVAQAKFDEASRCSGCGSSSYDEIKVPI